MRNVASTNLFAALPSPGRQRLMSPARDVFFPLGTRIFDEGGLADRFWVIRTGSVVLDTPGPGHRPAPVETLGSGALLGCTWLFPPYMWHLGAMAETDVRAEEFDATVVRALSRADLIVGEAMARRIAEIIAHRMQSARIRLLDLYGPRSGSPVP